MNVFCSQCGAAIESGSKFCTSCGTRLEQKEGNGTDASPPVHSRMAVSREEYVKGISEQVKGTFSQATRKINSMVGEEGAIELNLKDVFSAVFQKHSNEEAETLFTSGTKLTTPSEQDISTTWPKPWLFSRVFFVLAITYVLLNICTYSFQNNNTIPGLIMIGSVAVPFSLLIFFWETNAPRNISIYEVIKMFFIGGTSSLVITLLLYSFFSPNDVSMSGAALIGVIEELGKLVIVGYFIYKLDTKYILNGLLIGAAVGAGFASFESAGYAFNLGEAFGSQAMITTIFERAWTAIGGHSVWAAISGAALVYVKGSQPLKSEHFFNVKFLRIFLVPIVLHALWDAPFETMANVRLIVLIVIAWLFIFSLINAGLKQIMRIHQAGQPSTSELKQQLN